jgi:uncharacterized protein YbaP (TraB family)
MKRISVLTFLLLGFILFNAVETQAQTKGKFDGPSLLYQVSGKGLAKPSYIFGTFHAICSADMVPFESLDPYLAETDQLIMEIDMDDSVEMRSMTKGVIIPDGKTLKDFLTAEEFVKVDEMIKNLLGFSADNVKMVKPSLLTVIALTSPKAIGCTPTVYDVSLMQNAVAKKKPIVGLETVASQIKVIDSKPIDKQAKDLYEMALDPQKSINELKKLMAAYKERDPEKLFKITNIQATTDIEFHTRLLADRNFAWIPKLETAFKERPTFVAVGAGHLGGKNGVIKLLRKKGYKVKPVKL